MFTIVVGFNVCLALFLLGWKAGRWHERQIGEAKLKLNQSWNEAITREQRKHKEF